MKIVVTRTTKKTIKRTQETKINYDWVTGRQNEQKMYEIYKYASIFENDYYHNCYL